MREDLIQERLQKLEALRRAGIDPYPARVKRTHTIGEARQKFGSLSRAKKKLALVGRVLSVRNQGALLFVDVRDESGQLQAVFKKGTFKDFALFRDTLDRGDFVNIRGILFKTKRGEMSVEVTQASIIVKSLRPLPTEHFGLEELETRLRQRYLDLLLNPAVKEMFIQKSRFWTSVRQFLINEGFMEVETGILQQVAGGAEAEPFITHHNALDVDFYLRISLELPLKKMLVGGFEQIFEIGRVFRNEGIDRDHLQEFTFMEFYWAYHDYEDLMKLLERMYKHIVKSTVGKLTTTWQGQTINWGARWPRIDYVKEFAKANGFDPVNASREELMKKAKELKLEPEANLGKGRLIDLIYKKTVRPTLIQPCFLVNTPLEVSPLSKASAERPGVAERVQPVACGSEIGNGYSELNDPIDQRRRFAEQEALRAAGDKEAHPFDEDFLIALEHGMPPTAGFGLSERLFALLMDKPIRETTIFPLMRPKG